MFPASAMVVSADLLRMRKLALDRPGYRTVSALLVTIA